MTSGPRKNELAIVVSDLSSGGAQRVVTTLANHWAAAGRAVAVITLADDKTDYFELNPRVERLIVGGVGPSRSIIGAVKGNLRRIQELRQTLVRANAPTVAAFIGATNVLTVMAAKRLGMKVVISERNDPARQSLGRIWDLLRRMFYRRADLVTANSQSAISTLSGYIGNKKLRLVHNPIFSPDPLPPRTLEPLILSVGRLVHQKAQDVLLDAFAAIANEAPDWKLAIVGEGPDEQALRDRAIALGIAGRVTFAGRADPWPWYARAKIFALPSRYEGTSNALLEAMAVGIPPVISDTSGGGLDVVTDGASGVITPVNDPSALAHAFRKLIADPEMRHRMGVAAADSMGVFSLEVVAAQWESILELPVPTNGRKL